MMEGNSTGAWVLGAVMVVIGFLGLFMAREATDSIFYGTGLVLSVFCVLVIFDLIRRHAGR